MNNSAANMVVLAAAYAWKDRGAGYVVCTLSEGTSLQGVITVGDGAVQHQSGTLCIKFQAEGCGLQREYRCMLSQARRAHRNIGQKIGDGHTVKFVETSRDNVSAKVIIS
jgi:hypothetical protein